MITSPTKIQDQKITFFITNIFSYMYTVRHEIITCILFYSTDIGVFFCGPSVLSHNLHQRCNEYTKKGGATGAHFYYNKENF